MESRSPSASDGPIYLDHAAATPLAAEVAEAMREAATAFANPSSPHAAGRAAKRTLENARERILELVGGRTSGPDRDRLVFTSGATEANRLGMLGLAGGRRLAEGQGQVWVSARDHSSIREAAAALVAESWQLVELPLSSTGQLDVRASATGWDGSPAAGGVASEPEPRRILAVTTVCGQTGIREDLPALAALARGHRELLIHADATQAAGWDELGFASAAATTLALAPHKFGGPRGIGGLVIRGSARLAAVVPGPQELGLRGGTEAVTLAAGFARAVELASRDRRAQADRVEALRHRLEAGLLAAAGAAGLEAVVVGERAPRSPHVAMIALASCDRQVVALAADRAGVCLATGTACASGSSEPPVVFRAMAVEPRFFQGGIRLSLGRTTTAEEIDEAIARLAEVFAHLGRLRTA
jgi:cysteine desulfurase